MPLVEAWCGVEAEAEAGTGGGAGPSGSGESSKATNSVAESSLDVIVVGSLDKLARLSLETPTSIRPIASMAARYTQEAWDRSQALHDAALAAASSASDARALATSAAAAISLDARDEEIARLQEVIRLRDRALEERDQTLAERTVEIKEMRDRATAQAAEVQRLTSAIAEVRAPAAPVVKAEAPVKGEPSLPGETCSGLRELVPFNVTELHFMLSISFPPFCVTRSNPFRPARPFALPPRDDPPPPPSHCWTERHTTSFLRVLIIRTCPSCRSYRYARRQVRAVGHRDSRSPYTGRVGVRQIGRGRQPRSGSSGVIALTSREAQG